MEKFCFIPSRAIIICMSCRSFFSIQCLSMCGFSSFCPINQIVSLEKRDGEEKERQSAHWKALCTAPRQSLATHRHAPPARVRPTRNWRQFSSYTQCREGRDWRVGDGRSGHTGRLKARWDCNKQSKGLLSLQHTDPSPLTLLNTLRL